MPSVPWPFIVDTPVLRVQQNPDDPSEYNFDAPDDGLFLIDGYYTVKVKKNQVKYTHKQHLAKVAEGLEDFDVENLPEAVQPAAKEIIFEYEIPF